MLLNVAHSMTPCPCCSKLIGSGTEVEQIRLEMVLPLPERFAPLARTDVKDGKETLVKRAEPICYDCAAAEGLMSLTRSERTRQGLLDFVMARIAIGGERQEMLRLTGVRMGTGLARACADGDLNRLRDWQRSKFGDEEERDAVRKDLLLEGHGVL
jgi:hypothetical protein